MLLGGNDDNVPESFNTLCPLSSGKADVKENPEIRKNFMMR